MAECLELEKQDIDLEYLEKMRYFYLGFNAFLNHPYVRTKKDFKVIWQEGSTKLLEYKASAAQEIVLFIPSLINKSYILDLQEKQSLIDYLREQNINCYLIDWGEPEEFELEFSFGDYLDKRVNKCVREIHKLHNTKITIAGYCMGGLFASAAFFTCKKYIKKIALLATPFDFSKMPFFNLITEHFLDGLVFNRIPYQYLNMAFFSLDPKAIFEKFVKFGKNELTEEEKIKFVATEKWISDGISLSTKLLKELIDKLYLKNDLYKNNFVFGKHKINFSKDKRPFLLGIPLLDKIVPCESSFAARDIISNYKLIEINSGHIGMILSKRAKEEFWIPLANWIKADSI